MSGFIEQYVFIKPRSVLPGGFSVKIPTSHEHGVVSVRLDSYMFSTSVGADSNSLLANTYDKLGVFRITEMQDDIPASYMSPFGNTVRGLPIILNFKPQIGVGAHECLFMKQYEGCHAPDLHRSTSAERYKRLPKSIELRVFDANGDLLQVNEGVVKINVAFIPTSSLGVSYLPGVRAMMYEPIGNVHPVEPAKYLSGI